MSRTQVQTARFSVGREVRRMDSDVGELAVYNALEEVRRRRLCRRVQSTGCQIARSLPVGGEVAEELRPQQRAVTTVLAPPPHHVICTAYFNAY